MRHLKLLLSAICIGLWGCPAAYAQLNIRNVAAAEELAQKLVGSGVEISNVKFTGNLQMAGIFTTDSFSTNIGMTDGIVLCNGRAASGRNFDGMNGDGVRPATAVEASTPWLLPGDTDLANALGTPATDLFDACVLEFDFIPIGDSVQFRYVFGSEEYQPSFVCQFNDAFAFFISGPGITGQKNIALVPGTNLPVSILNVNDVATAPCNNNINYYINNLENNFFNYDGHTTILTAAAAVNYCQTYHLKLVIADVGDDFYDSGVLIEARSLSSANLSLASSTKIDRQGKPYIVEGCGPRSFTVKRPRATAQPLIGIVKYEGNAINGIDYDLLSSAVFIPAGASEFTVNINPLQDNINEGTELLKLYVLFGCDPNNATTINDSLIIEIRDYDTLAISPDTAVVCRGGTVQLTAEAGYTTYLWGNDAALSNINVPNPIVNLADSAGIFRCTASTGNCRARDSAFVLRKAITGAAVANNNCTAGSAGSIAIAINSGWQQPASFAINQLPYVSSNTFDNLSSGTYLVKVKDAAGCTDSLAVLVKDLYAPLLLDTSRLLPASCGGVKGTITFSGNGGLLPYRFSTDGSNYFSNSTFLLDGGAYTAWIKDSNGCTAGGLSFVVPYISNLALVTMPDTAICTGTSIVLRAFSPIATNYSWQPHPTLTGSNTPTPQAMPTETTTYYVTAAIDTCSGTDSVTIRLLPLPAAQAGRDTLICFGSTARLNAAIAKTWQWQPALLLTAANMAQTSTLPLRNTQVFTLLVSDSNGCVSPVADSIVVNVEPSPRLQLPADTTILINQPITLQAVDVSGIGFVSYVWMPASGLSATNTPTVIFDARANAQYTVTGTTAAGCQGSDSIVIKVVNRAEIYVPSSFTPNGDGLNDWLYARPVGLRQLLRFSIYNRYGQLVFTTANPLVGWPGPGRLQYNAAEAFVWVAEGIALNGARIFRKGTVMAIK
jgi:gliding motility-associated-like protein